MLYSEIKEKNEAVDIVLDLREKEDEDTHSKYRRCVKLVTEAAAHVSVTREGN